MDKKAQGSSKLQEYEIQSKLGQGSFGVVYKVKRKTDQKTYVLKQIDISRMSSSQKKEAVLEATILSKINSPYIVKFYESFTDKNQINIVMEFCENGDLGQYLKRQIGKQLTESRIWKFFLEMCLGLQYLHANKILHRDIKTINMFLTKDDRIKIGDLGVAKMLNQTANFAHTVVGTPYYLSPELCEEKPYNHKSDIWSLGCVLYELCTLRHPFESNNQGALILKIVRGKYNPISSQYSRDLSNMVDSCLCKDYKKRPSIQEILEKPIMVEKASYFGYPIQRPIDLKPGQGVLPQSSQQPSAAAQQQPKPTQPTPPSSQQQQQQQQQDHLKKITDAANALMQKQQQQKQPPSNPSSAISKEKQYYQNLADARLKQLPQVPQPKKDDKPKLPVQSSNIPSSYIDPSKKNVAPVFITPQQVQNPQPVSKNLLNNNQFDIKEYERKQQLASNLQPQKRPLSNQNQRPVALQQPLLQQQQKPVEISPSVKQLVNPAAQQQQQPVQLNAPRGQINNQRVKSGAPTQLSRQAQIAQKQGQKLIKAGDTDRPLITKPDIKALRPQISDRVLPSQQPLIPGISKPTSQSGKASAQEIQEVMNLPDDVDRKRGNGHQMKSNQELILEAQRKKEALNRVNSKYAQDISQKSPEELHNMKLMIPSSSQQQSQYHTPSSRVGGDQSTNAGEEEELLVPVNQKVIDDDEFAELLNGGSGDFVQAKWNIEGQSQFSAGGLRETQFVPTYEESKDDDDGFFKVHHDRDNSPYHGKMNTIKEEDEDRRSHGSDTAYFSPDNDFNDRDDEQYDSEEETKDYQKRFDMLGFGEDDEDNQPYDQEEEERRHREEFGDDEEEQEEDEEPVDRMSMTAQQEKIRALNQDIKRARNRQRELELKLDAKMKEGTGLVGTQHFHACFNFFCEKASKVRFVGFEFTQADDLAEEDAEEITEFVNRQIGQEKGAYLTSILFTTYYMKDELVNQESRIEELNQQLADLMRPST